MTNETPSSVVETSDISINSSGASLVASHGLSLDRWPPRRSSLFVRMKHSSEARYGYSAGRTNYIRSFNMRPGRLRASSLSCEQRVPCTYSRRWIMLGSSRRRIQGKAALGVTTLLVSASATAAGPASASEAAQITCAAESTTKYSPAAWPCGFGLAKQIPARIFAQVSVTKFVEFIFPPFRPYVPLPSIFLGAHYG